MRIIPIRDLKNTTDVERLCENENGPIFVTKNGYGKLVVMSIDYYEQNLKNIYEAKTILEGIEDVKNGDVVDGETAIKNVKKKYGI